MVIFGPLRPLLHTFPGEKEQRWSSQRTSTEYTIPYPPNAAPGLAALQDTCRSGEWSVGRDLDPVAHLTGVLSLLSEDV